MSFFPRGGNSLDESGGADCQSLVNCTPHVLVRHNSFLRHLKKEVVNRREDHKLSSSYTDQEVTRHLIVTAPSAPSPALSLSSLTSQQRRKCPSRLRQTVELGQGGTPRGTTVKLPGSGPTGQHTPQSLFSAPLCPCSCCHCSPEG